MAEQQKDFAYYAEKAEHQMQLSLGRDEDGMPLYLDDNAKTRHAMRAQVYATLATAAPKADGNRVEGNQPMNFNDGTR
jgi:hypothetical protein